MRKHFTPCFRLGGPIFKIQNKKWKKINKTGTKFKCKMLNKHCKNMIAKNGFLKDLEILN